MISLRSFQGGIERAYDEGILSSAYTVLRHNPTLLDAGYLARLFKSKPFLGELELNVTGIREGQNINYGSLRESRLPLPPLEEQRTIADFLDAMDVRITRFIAARKKMIRLLEEKKQAVINQAVTKGLDPTVPMRDSGVDWLGEVPAHWEIRKLRRLTTLITKGTTPTSIGRNFSDSGIRFVKVESLSSNMDLLHQKTAFIDGETDSLLARSRLHEDDVLIAIAGAIGRLAVVSEADVPANTNQAVGIIRPRQDIASRWLARVLSATAIQRNLGESSVQSAQANLSLGDLGQQQIMVPCYGEQVQIAEYLDREVVRLNAVTSRSQREIELMQEYRTRLTSDVVTGKLDVRGVDLGQLPEFEEIPEEDAQELAGEPDAELAN